VINDGEKDMDVEATLVIYGDPEEKLGRSIAIGDIDGNGVADAAIGGLRGARRVVGIDCPRDAYQIPTDSLAFIDIDGDGKDELFGSSLEATVNGAVDAGSVWMVRDGADPSLWRGGAAADLLGISLFALPPTGIGVVAQDEVRLWGSEDCSQ
jgi:hypothetical protein